MWYVYLALCQKDGSYYTGITNDLEARIKAHNEGKGARYTKGRGPIVLLKSIKVPDKSIASKMERQIKRLKKKDKLTAFEVKKINHSPYFIYYTLVNLYHREDGPAIEYSNGEYSWYLYGEKHRDNGPAEQRNGDTCWYQHGKFHREDGPAVEYYDGSKGWYYQGKHIRVDSQEEFERYIKIMFLE